MEYGSEGLSYSCPLKCGIVINNGTQLPELLSKIYTVMGLDKEQNKLKLTCRYPFTLGIGPNMNTYVGLEIVNDELVIFVVNLVLDNPNIASVALYVETKDINIGIGSSQTRGCITTTPCLTLSCLGKRWVA